MRDFRLLTAGLLLVMASSSADGAFLDGAILYATDAEGQTLNTLSVQEGLSDFVGNFGVGGHMAGLAYDARNGMLYGTTTETDNLYSIDMATGGATIIGPLGTSLMHGLAFDNSTGILYGSTTTYHSLYEINTSSGAATLIGDIGFSSVGGLAIHPKTHVLYGSKATLLGNGGLIRIDKTTGQGTLVAPTHAANGLAFDPFTDTLYAVYNGGSASSPDMLYTIDIVTGQATLIGPTGLGNTLGLEFGGWVIPEPSTLVLLGIGTIGLLFHRKSR
jgi:hypothetical protein